MKKNTFFISLLILLAGMLLNACSGITKYSPAISIDYEQIKLRGKLKAVTHVHLTDYFVFRGAPMGFQWDLLKTFGEAIAVETEIYSLDRVEDPIRDLLSGKVDIVASSGLFPEDAVMDSLILIPVVRVKQVLVARKGRSDDRFDNKVVFVQQGSSFAGKLNRMGKHVNVMQIPDYQPEEWIHELQSGIADYLACEESRAAILVRSHPEFEIVGGLSYDLDYKVWMMRANSVRLAQFTEDWLEGYKKTRLFSETFTRYFDLRNVVARARSQYFPILSGKISPYDELVRKYGEQIGWDWKWLVALMYNESSFNPKAVSPAGAYGLMQLMPATLEKYGLDSTATVEDQILAASLYLKELDRFFESSVPDKEERIKFVLAAYNSGPGHILDAQRIALNTGRFPGVWEGNVDLSLLSKSSPDMEFDSDVVRHGVCRGTETFRFVRNMMICYQSYGSIVPD